LNLWVKQNRVNYEAIDVFVGLAEVKLRELGCLMNQEVFLHWILPQSYYQGLMNLPQR